MLAEDSGDFTDESYYEHPAGKKETKSVATATEGLPGHALKVDTTKGDGYGYGGGHGAGVAGGSDRVNYAKMPFLDLLSHEIYV